MFPIAINYFPFARNRLITELYDQIISSFNSMTIITFNKISLKKVLSKHFQ